MSKNFIRIGEYTFTPYKIMSVVAKNQMGWAYPYRLEIKYHKPWMQNVGMIFNSYVFREHKVYAFKYRSYLEIRSDFDKIRKNCPDIICEDAALSRRKGD